MITMPSISVCIPSYKRPSNVKTLQICPWAKLYVDENEADEYRNGNPNANVIEIPNGIQGNIARVRNYILQEEFANGADAVCMMDDDIRHFGLFHGDERGFGYVREWITGEEFGKFVERGTELCDDMGLTMWGVNIIEANRQYHQSEPFSLVKPILGPFSVHLSNDYRYDESIPLKEDYDMFLQHLLRERAVLRMNMAFYVNGGSDTAIGGCAASRNVKSEQRQFDMLRKKWGGANRQEGRREQAGIRLQPEDIGTD